MKHLICGLLLALTFFSCQSEKEITFAVNPLFTDHMVLQRGEPCKVYGTAPSGTEVTVKYLDSTVSCITDESGRWIATLGTFQATNKSNDLTITTKSQTIRLADVVVGDVWLCSGQSNMQMNLGCTWAKVNNSEAEVQAANYPDVRLFSVEPTVAAHPLENVRAKHAWMRCTPEVAADFSAVGYFFGRKVYKELNVPIGLIQSVWGGTIAEAWTSVQGFPKGSKAYGAARIIEAMPAVEPSDSTAYKAVCREQLIAHNKEKAILDQGIAGNDTLFASVQYDAKDWLPVNVPFYIENTPLGNMNGCVWARKHFQIDKEKTSLPSTLHIGPVDDIDETWINGVKVGENNGWDVRRVYDIPSNLLHAGDNVISVRIQDIWCGGGIGGKATNQYIAFDDGSRVDIQSDWCIHLGYNNQELNTIYLREDQPNFPTFLYNGMISPLLNFTIKGAIWYQGENNDLYAYHYRKDFRRLINDWRAHWKKPELPFLYVQLANFHAQDNTPSPSLWAELRESQASVLDLPSVYMATAIDLGDTNNIHPSHKQEVGDRLAHLAFGGVYKIADLPQYPMIQEVKMVRNKAYVTLNLPINKVEIKQLSGNKGFAVAGTDQKFVWAKVQRTKNSLVLVAPKGMNIASVRYAWSDNPSLSVFSKNGLPLLPYRTDAWEVSSQYTHAEYE